MLIGVPSKMLKAAVLICLVSLHSVLAMTPDNETEIQIGNYILRRRSNSSFSIVANGSNYECDDFQQDDSICWFLDNDVIDQFLDHLYSSSGRRNKRITGLRPKLIKKRQSENGEENSKGKFAGIISSENIRDVSPFVRANKQTINKALSVVKKSGTSISADTTLTTHTTMGPDTTISTTMEPETTIITTMEPDTTITTTMKPDTTIPTTMEPDTSSTTTMEPDTTSTTTMEPDTTSSTTMESDTTSTTTMEPDTISTTTMEPDTTSTTTMEPDTISTTMTQEIFATNNAGFPGLNKNIKADNASEVKISAVELHKGYSWKIVAAVGFVSGSFCAIIGFTLIFYMVKSRSDRYYTVQLKSFGLFEGGQTPKPGD